MENCIFCKIINNEIPSFKIYEDDKFLVILDRFPSNIGHTLLITKKHFKNIFDLEDVYAKEIFALVTKLSKVLKNVLSLEGLNVLQNNGAISGQIVEHFHIHLIPRFENDNVKISWDNLKLNDDDFANVLSKIKENL